MVDDIQRAVGQCTAKQVFFAFDRFKSFESALAGREVTAVEAPL
jgi:endonuclease-8